MWGVLYLSIIFSKYEICPWSWIDKVDWVQAKIFLCFECILGIKIIQVEHGGNKRFLFFSQNISSAALRWDQSGFSEGVVVRLSVACK